MRYAPVMPPKHLDGLQPRDNIAYFCFADVAMIDAAYRHWFDDKKFVVLDCPVYEGGPILTAQALKALVNDMPGIEFCIIPDVIDDRDATLKRFFEYVKIIDHPSCTGVPQGKTVEDALDCAIDMIGRGNINRLAIPNKRAWSHQATRRQLIHAITMGIGIADAMAPEFAAGKLKFHLLGADFPYTDEMECATLPGVVSLDTAEPINAAYSSHVFDSTWSPARKRPADFFTRARLSKGQVNRNVGAMQKWLNSSVTMAGLSDEGHVPQM